MPFRPGCVPRRRRRGRWPRSFVHVLGWRFQRARPIVTGLPVLAGFKGRDHAVPAPLLSEMAPTRTLVRTPVRLVGLRSAVWRRAVALLRRFPRRVAPPDDHALAPVNTSSSRSQPAGTGLDSYVPARLRSENGSDEELVFGLVCAAGLRSQPGPGSARNSLENKAKAACIAHVNRLE